MWHCSPERGKPLDGMISVDAVSALLEFRFGFLAAERDFFHPKPQGLPVNQNNHLQRDQRIADRKAGEVRGGEFLASAGDGADQILSPPR